MMGIVDVRWGGREGVGSGFMYCKKRKVGVGEFMGFEGKLGRGVGGGGGGGGGVLFPKKPPCSHHHNNKGKKTKPPIFNQFPWTARKPVHSAST